MSGLFTVGGVVVMVTWYLLVDTVNIVVYNSDIINN